MLMQWASGKSKEGLQSDSVRFVRPLFRSTAVSSLISFGCGLSNVHIVVRSST